jgi:hypothetical protein
MGLRELPDLVVDFQHRLGQLTMTTVVADHQDMFLHFGTDHDFGLMKACQVGMDQS